MTVESGVHEEREDEPGAHEAHGVDHPTLDGRARRADIRPVGSRWRGSMSKVGQAAIAIVVAAAVLWLAAWLDGTVMRDIQRQAAASFDETGLELAYSLGSLAVAGSVLLLGVLAWRSPSALVGVAYILVGGFFAFMPVIVFPFAAQINGAPPLLPGPIADAVGQIYFSSFGPLNAVATVGAGMFVVGLLVVGRALRARVVGRRVQPMTSIEAQPIRQ